MVGNTTEARAIVGIKVRKDVDVDLVKVVLIGEERREKFWAESKNDAIRRGGQSSISRVKRKEKEKSRDNKRRRKEKERKPTGVVGVDVRKKKKKNIPETKRWTGTKRSRGRKVEKSKK